MAIEVFAWQPLFDATGKIKHRGYEVRYGDGYAAAIGDGINTKTQDWDLQFRGRDALILPIRDFLDAHGSTRRFLWTPPKGVQGTYLAGEYTQVDVGVNRCQISVTFKYRPTP